jgi:hypothetical protein
MLKRTKREVGEWVVAVFKDGRAPQFVHDAHAGSPNSTLDNFRRIMDRKGIILEYRKPTHEEYLHVTGQFTPDNARLEDEEFERRNAEIMEKHLAKIAEKSAPAPAAPSKKK